MYDGRAANTEPHTIDRPCNFEIPVVFYIQFPLLPHKNQKKKKKKKENQTIAIKKNRKRLFHNRRTKPRPQFPQEAKEKVKQKGNPRSRVATENRLRSETKS